MLFYGIKFYRVKKEILSEKRLGIYKYSSHKGLVFVYVEEIEKYDNDMSKIKFKKIEFVNVDTYYKNDLKDMVKNKFASLKKTSEIDWLEVKQTLKNIRREKLKQINKFKK